MPIRPIERSCTSITLAGQGSDFITEITRPLSFNDTTYRPNRNHLRLTMKAQALSNCGDTFVGPTRPEFDPYVNGPANPTAATISLDFQKSFYKRAAIDTFLERIDDDSWPLPEDDELDDPIHSIFAEEKFQDMRYEVLKPALRLVSLFLLSPGSLEYMYAAMISPLREMLYANATEEQPRTFKAISRKRTSLTRADVARIKEILELLGNLITFRKLLGEGKSSGAVCTAQLDIKADSIYNADGTPWRGTGSQISLSVHRYDLLCDIHDSLLTGDIAKREQYLYVSAEIAKTIMHEVAHAVRAARFEHEIQHGFEDQCLSEEGFDLENIVFGGMLTIGQYGAILKEYPCSITFDSYMSHRNMGGGMFVASAPAQDLAIHWKVGPSYITSLFRKSFWEHRVPDRGADALKVTKFVGYRLLPSAERGFCKCCDCVARETIVKAFVDAGNRPIDHEALENTIGEQYADFERRRAEKHRSTYTHSKASIPTMPEREEASASSLDRHRMPIAPATASDASCEQSAQLNGDIFLTHCARLDWDVWPWGSRDVRLHGASKDPQTYGVPDGYVSLLDGTLVRADCADQFYDEETRRNVEAIDAIALSLVEKREAEADESKNEEAKLRSRKFCAVLEEILDSDDPAMWRLADAVSEDLMD